MRVSTLTDANPRNSALSIPIRRALLAAANVWSERILSWIPAEYLSPAGGPDATRRSSVWAVDGVFDSSTSSDLADIELLRIGPFFEAGDGRAAERDEPASGIASMIVNDRSV